MTAIIRTYRGGICSICMTRFKPEDQQYTHVGGKDHYGFHRPCLENWLAIKAICPLDRKGLDCSFPLSRIDQITQWFKSASVKAAYFGAEAVERVLLDAVAPALGIVILASTTIVLGGIALIGVGTVARTAAAVGLGGEPQLQ